MPNNSLARVCGPKGMIGTTIAPHLNLKSSCVETGGVSDGLWFLGRVLEPLTWHFHLAGHRGKQPLYTRCIESVERRWDTPTSNESSTQNAVGLQQKCHVHLEDTLRARLGKLSALGRLKSLTSSVLQRVL
ncbi:hypothetical protein CBL_04003 [Carabus blaptoides fortunei]